MTYNPNATGTVGLEWRPYKTGSVALSSSSLCVAAQITSTATETIDSVLMPYEAVGAASSYGKLWAEIYNLNDLGTLDETPTVYTFTPNEDRGVTNLFYTSAGTPAWSVGPYNVDTQNLDQYIDDTTDESTDYIMGGATSFIRLAFNTAALAAGRVLSVSFEIRAFSYASFPCQGLYVDLYNGTSYVARLGTVQPPATGDDTAKPFQNYTLGPFYTNPLTEEPWTRTDIINMDTGTNLLLALTWRSNTTAVAAVRMKVSMCTEKRLAVGANTKVTTPPTGVQYGSTNACTLKTPAGVDNWAKTTGNDYLVVVRRLDDPLGVLASQTPSFTHLDSDVANPHDQGHAFDITIDAAGRLLTNGGALTRAHGCLLTTSGGSLSVDSQVYYAIRSGRAYSGVTTTQLFSNAASTTYGTIRVVVGVIGSPTAALSVKIKRASDNVQMGGTGTLAVADLSTATYLGVADGTTWYDATITLASAATLVSGTQYYIELSSTTSATKPWYTPALKAQQTVGVGDQSFGGATDYANIEGGSFTYEDITATASTTATEPPAPPAPPSTPGSLSVYVVSYTLPDAGDPICDVGSHQVVRILWGATSEGVLFDYYGIERSEDGGTTWTLIKREHTEATTTFDDVEAKRGVTLKYRIRMVRTTGQVGAYLTQSGTSICNVNRRAVIFCTNAYSSLTCGYIRLGAQHEYLFLSDSEVSVVQMHERNFQVLFRPTENRGVLTDIPVLIFTKGEASVGNEVPPGGAGIAAFDTARAIVESDAPYVCVHTPDGERLFAGLRLPQGLRTEPASFYATTITAIQVADEPSVVD